MSIKIAYEGLANVLHHLNSKDLNMEVIMAERHLRLASFPPDDFLQHIMGCTLEEVAITLRDAYFPFDDIEECINTVRRLWPEFIVEDGIVVGVLPDAKWCLISIVLDFAAPYLS